MVVGKFWKIWVNGVALLVAGFLFFSLDLMFMFFDSVMVIWVFLFFILCVCVCVCLPRKFMGLKAKVCFTGDMSLGFGSLLEIDYGEEH